MLKKCKIIRLDRPNVFYRRTKNLKSIAHSDYVNNCNANLSLLTDMKHDYINRLKLTIIWATPNTLNIVHLSTQPT
jgi:hypothetical protein